MNWMANILTQAASIPEGQNQLKRTQLRELAALNGTLRDDENQACQNCSCSCTSPFQNGNLLTWLQVVKSVIVNTTAQNSAISPRVSFVEFAGMLVIWQEIVPIARGAPIGAIADPVAQAVDSVLSKAEMPLIVKWRLVTLFSFLKKRKKPYTNFISSNLCKNFLVAHHLQPTVKNHEESKVDLTALTKTVETAMELIATVISAVMIVI